MNDRQGVVVLVGAGPGDPGLITRAGADAISRADVIVHDQLVHPRLLDLAPPNCRRIFAGKQGGKPSVPQDEIHRILLEEARLGRFVVRLKGGDPFVFGRGAEEVEFLRKLGVACRVIPGVTAAIGVTASAGIPVTHRDEASSVAFVTGHQPPGSTDCRLDWDALARFPGTLVVYMGLSHLNAICNGLIAAGKAPNTPAAIVQSGTTGAQKTAAGTLADLPEIAVTVAIGPPALLVVGSVVARRSALNWFEESPLFGRRVVVTRPIDIDAHPDDDPAVPLERLGAQVIAAPMVTVEPIDAPLPDLRRFDWLVFTSKNGVAAFFRLLDRQGKDARILGHLQIAAIGPGTADALARYRIQADLMPDSHRSEGLADGLLERASGRRILLVRADRGRTVLVDRLRDRAEVETLVVYRNADADSLPVGLADRVARGAVDWITLTSPAIVRNLHRLLPESARVEVGRSVKLAAISPITAEAARSLGWEVAAVADPHTWGSLIDAIVRS